MIGVFKKPDITTIYFEIVILFFGSMKVLTTRFQEKMRMVGICMKPLTQSWSRSTKSDQSLDNSLPNS